MNEDEQFLHDIGALPTASYTWHDVGAFITIIMTVSWFYFLYYMLTSV